MEKRIKILFCIFSIVIMFLLNNSVNSQDVTIEDDGVHIHGILDEKASIYHIFNSSLDNITPNYQIISLVDKKTINGGDNFTISFQISGNGKVTSNKLIIYFPELLIKGNLTFYSYLSEININGTLVGAVWLDKYPLTTKISKEGAFMSCLNVTFRQSEKNITTVFGEEVFNGHRPISVKAVSNESTPSGDNTIKIQLVYSDGINWYSSQDEVVIHIREWYELLWIQLLIPIIMVILGILIDRLWIRSIKNKEGLSDTEKQESNNNEPEKRNVNKT